MRISIELDSGDAGIAEILAAVVASYGKQTGRQDSSTPTVSNAPKAIEEDETPIKPWEGPIPPVPPSPEQYKAAVEFANSHIAPVPPPVEESVGIKVDITGKPWNPDVHSSSKETTANGMWKFRRGLPPEIRDAYLAGGNVPRQEPEAPLPPTEMEVLPLPPVVPVAKQWTFPLLMTEATKKAKTQEEILAVLKNVSGLSSLAELVAYKPVDGNALTLPVIYDLLAAGLGI